MFLPMSQHVYITAANTRHSVVLLLPQERCNQDSRAHVVVLVGLLSLSVCLGCMLWTGRSSPWQQSSDTSRLPVHFSILA
jgi:hypothetical protein